MKVMYEVNVKFNFYEEVQNVEQISDPKEVAEVISQMISDKLAQYDVVTSYDIIEYKINAEKCAKENVSNFLFIKRNEIN